MTSIEISERVAGIIAELECLYPRAFPDENLIPLLGELYSEAPGLLSLVATSNRAVVGHALFTTCSITGRPDKVALLGPVAVDPDYQKNGTGSALIKDGLNRLAKAGYSRVLVLGDPDYYGRFGFLPETSISPPFEIPVRWQEAWQGVSLQENKSKVSGMLEVPKPWAREALWLP